MLRAADHGAEHAALTHLRSSANGG